MPRHQHYGLPARGETYYAGQGGIPTASAQYANSVYDEGKTQTFKDNVPSTAATGAKQRRTDRDVVCELVRNVGAAALTPGRLVTYAAGYYHKRVDGYCTENYQSCAGVIDEHLPAAGCPVHDLCWIVVSGPTLVKTPLEADATNVFSEGTHLVALTAATSGATTSGRPQPMVATSSVTDTNTQLLNRIGVALSAKTTGNTNVDMLVNIEILKN